MVQSILHHQVALHDMAVHRRVKNQSADCLGHQKGQVAILNNYFPNVEVYPGLVEEQDDQRELASRTDKDVHIELHSLILPHLIALESLLLPLSQLVFLFKETRVVLVDKIDGLERATGCLLDFYGAWWLRILLLCDLIDSPVVQLCDER